MLEYNTRYEYTQRLDMLYIHNKNFFKHFFFCIFRYTKEVGKLRHRIGIEFLN